MPMARCRGKSTMLNDDNDAVIGGQPNISTATTTTAATAATTISTTTNQQQLQPQQQQQNYLPQTSLLKIEPFVPSFNQRQRRRPIGRSYSTLSHNVIPKRNGRQPLEKQHQQNLLQQQQQSELVLDCAQATTPQQQQQQQQQLPKRSYATGTNNNLRQQRLPGRGVITRQRSKSTSSSAASNSCRPATAAAVGCNSASPATCVGSTGGTLVSGAIVTPQANGICRIQRLPKEREDLPDRINYDRRGLTAIPIFEQEPNLRLLSLQHNLINIFHIPEELPPPPPPPPQQQQPQSSGVTQSSSKRDVAESRTTGHRHVRLTRAFTNAGSNGNRLSPQSNSPSSSPLTTQALAINGGNGGGAGGHRSKLVKRNSLLQRGFNFVPPPPPAPQQPQPHSQQHLRLRYGLEKSKSFVASYGPAPRSLQAMKQHHQLMQRRALLKASGGMGVSMLQSCDELGAEDEDGPTGHQQHQQQLEQLSIKNKQLSISASYGGIFQQLVFLDLYDNQIERIANLDGLPSLSVLLLGKNRITDIGGLSSLRSTLRVLDLHGNKLTSISNRINCLHHLKSLNLAGNQIRQINQQDFNGLRCLKELNLKRNKIRRVNGFQHLVTLERLWLCHNELHKVDDMASIACATKLLEVTIENNPVSLAGDCVSFLVSYLPLLQSLSQMPITEQVRRAALAWRQHKELAEAQAAKGSTDAYNSIRREEVISNARTNWELLRSQQTMQAAAAHRSPKKLTSELAKINELNETTTGDSTDSPVVIDQLQALVKLPPIGTLPLVEEDASSEASSLGPNVDSCSSCYSSDNEDCRSSCKLNQPSQSQVQSQPQAPVATDENCNKLQPATEPAAPPAPAPSPPPPAVTLTPPTETAENPSARPTTPTTTLTLPLPTATNPSPNGRPASSKQRTRNAPITQLGLHLNSGRQTPSRRYMPGSLVRSQTVVGSGGGGSSTASNSSSGNSGRGGKQSSNNFVTFAPTATSASPTQTTTSTATTTTNQTKTSASSAQTTTNANANAATAAISVTKTSAAEREREQGGDYLIEICGRYLNIYGQGALRFIDKQWNPTKANDVHTLNFSYINFNNIVGVLGRIKVRFPHAEHFVFRETNISCLGQLNALAELQGITSLLIDSEGNAINSKPLWRAYAIYRLSHWGLKQLNGVDVAEPEVEAANAMFTGLSDLVLWSMPDVMLQPLLARLRLDESCTASKLSPKEWLMRADNKSLRLVVGKEALQWKKSPGSINSNNNNTTTSSSSTNTTSNQQAASDGSTILAPSAPLSARDRGRQHFMVLLENTCNAVEKLHRLETLWPNMLVDIVRNTLLDYAQLDVYLGHLMCELMK